MSDLSVWLGRELKRHEMTASDFARKAGVHTSMVYRWLSGETQPSPESCELIADALRADYNAVLALAGYPVETGPRDPVSPAERLSAMLRRVDLAADNREATLSGVLRIWLDQDAARRGQQSAAVRSPADMRAGARRLPHMRTMHRRRDSTIAPNLTHELTRYNRFSQPVPA